MVELYPLFLNLVLGAVILVLFIFYRGRVEASEKAQQEIEAVLRIRIEAKTRELKDLAESLEEKAKERTKELQTRVKELERFQKLTVGRELKMIDLKREIEELKKKLEQYDKK